MTEQTNSRRIKGDLLHMIDRAFEEAGIQAPALVEALIGAD